MKAKHIFPKKFEKQNFSGIKNFSGSDMNVSYNLM